MEIEWAVLIDVTIIIASPIQQMISSPLHAIFLGDIVIEERTNQLAITFSHPGGKIYTVKQHPVIHILV